MKVAQYLQRLGAAIRGKSMDWFAKGLDGPVGQAEKLNNAYANSVWVNSAIQYAANPIGDVPLNLMEGDQPLDENSPAWEMVRQMSQDADCDFTFQTAGWMLLEGEAFWVLDDAWLRPFPEIGELTPPRLVRPSHMRHVVKAGELDAWVMTLPGGRREVLVREQVIHRKQWNPYDDFRGLAQAKVALDAAETDYLAGKFTRNMMANNGDQGVYVVAKNGMPEGEQRDQIIAQLREKRAYQQRGEFKPIFLWGDIEVQDPKIRTVDAAFLDGRIASKEEIFSAFRVPPSMASKMESYSVGSASDWFRLIIDTCKPLGKQVAKVWWELLSKMESRLTEVGFDWDEHPVMQQVRTERVDAGTKLWDRGMPMKSVNEYLRLGMEEYDGWDVGYLPFSVTPSRSLQDPATDPAFGEERSNSTAPVTKALDELESIIRTAAEAGSPPKTKSEEEEDTFQDDRPQAEIAQWRQQMTARRPIEKAFTSRFSRDLMTARAEVLANIERLLGEKSMQAKATAADLNFNLSNFRGTLLVGMRAVSKRALDASSEQLFDELQLDDPFVFADAEVLTYFRTRENLIAGAADDIHAEIQRELALGIDAGESTEDLAKRLRKKFSGISKERGERIAITETAAAFGHGRQVSMKEAGITRKRWLTSGNRNVRAQHADANGQEVGIDEPFAVGGEALMHPGDPAGSPWNVINCRCVSIPVKGEAEE